MIPFIKSNLRNKLLIVVVFSLLVGLLSVGTLLYFQIRSFLFHQLEKQVQNTIALAELELGDMSISQEDAFPLKEIVDKLKNILNYRTTVIDMNGNVIADSDVPLDNMPRLQNHLNRPEVQQALEKGWGFSARKSATINRELIYVSKLLKKGDESIGFLRLSLYAEDTYHLLGVVRRTFLVSGLLVLLVSGSLVVVLTRSMNRTLKGIIDNANKIADGDLSSKIDIRSNDELQDLGQILNEMSTELSESFDRLTRQREDLNTVLSSIKDGIIAIGPDGKIVFNNNKALHLLNIKEGQISGKYYQNVFLNKHLNTLMGKFFEQHLFISDEIELKESEILNVEINPFKLMENGGVGAVMVLRDITDFKKLERIRRDFVANVSHEFKNPLAAIHGYAETLLDWALEDPSVKRKYLKKILKQSRNLENLVSDLLKLARVEGLQQIELQKFNPVPLLKEIQFNYTEAAAEKNITFNREFPDRPVSVFGDREMFKTIFANLIDNAIKYSPPDSQVILKVTKEGNYLCISVMDTGMGIPPKYLDRIFERFFRVDKGRSRAMGGTGLGLSIVKHMAELQKAKVGVESELNKGSRFWVKFLQA